MLNTYEQHSKRKLIATILSIIVIAGVVVFSDQLKSSQLTKTTSALSSTSSNAPVATPASSVSSNSATTFQTSGFKDGTYSASSNYYVPHGRENIDVGLTIKNGVVTTVSIQNSEGDPQSAQYQEDFASVYKSHVVGKKISGLRLGIVAGASDTTKGFDDALTQITLQARA